MANDVPESEFLRRRATLERILRARAEGREADKRAVPYNRVVVEGVQCAHCNQSYELGTQLRKCSECGDTACLNSCPCNIVVNEGD